jgi:hypothetical protein
MPPVSCTFKAGDMIFHHVVKGWCRIHAARVFVNLLSTRIEERGGHNVLAFLRFMPRSP